LELARRGASVVVNDLGGGIKGEAADALAPRPADLVVEAIVAGGGKAVANYDSVEFGERIIQTAVDTFGRVDVLVNNAGILRDKSFKRMATSDWELIMTVHLKGVWACTKAAWTLMLAQGFGRIVNVSSPAGLYGNVGQVSAT
jgi:3-hydroxyacyl-CoA dehydrogenase/3a,7a,12a-trihydroxy-5b-cholest-24-enoyl-CoA hydratase